MNTQQLNRYYRALKSYQYLFGALFPKQHLNISQNLILIIKAPKLHGPAFSQVAGAQCRQRPALLGRWLRVWRMPRTTAPAQSPKRARGSLPFPPPRLPRRSPNTPALPRQEGRKPGAPSDLLPSLPQSPAPAPKAPAPLQSAPGVGSAKPGRSRVPVPVLLPRHLRSRARHLPRSQLFGRRKEV